jgi:hypothetical protein
VEPETVGSGSVDLRRGEYPLTKLFARQVTVFLRASGALDIRGFLDANSVDVAAYT